MGVQSFNDPAERGHLIGDVPALFLVAIILAVLMLRTLGLTVPVHLQQIADDVIE